jgi:hypothetical protein
LVGGSKDPGYMAVFLIIGVTVAVVKTQDNDVLYLLINNRKPVGCYSKVTTFFLRNHRLFGRGCPTADIPL